MRQEGDMKTVSVWLAVFLMAALLSGCGGAGQEEAQQAEAADAAADNDHVWKDQVETIDRAKDVEKQIKEADEARRKAIKDAGGG